MTAPAPAAGRTQTELRVSDRATKTIQASGEVCPEMLTVRVVS